MSTQEPPDRRPCSAIGVFYEGLAVMEKNGKWYHVLPSGEPAYPERYEKAEYFQGGISWVKGEKGWKLIDTQGKEVSYTHASRPD